MGYPAFHFQDTIQNTYSFLVHKYLLTNICFIRITGPFFIYINIYTFHHLHGFEQQLLLKLVSRYKCQEKLITRFSLWSSKFKHKYNKEATITWLTGFIKSSSLKCLYCDLFLANSDGQSARSGGKYPSNSCNQQPYTSKLSKSLQYNMQSFFHCVILHWLT